jgi:hypothetical protein
MLIDRDHVALTALYISLAALLTSLTNAVVSWTLTARNNPLRNDNLRVEESSYADGVGVRLCCVNSIWILLTRNGNIFLNAGTSPWRTALSESKCS